MIFRITSRSLNSVIQPIEAQVKVNEISIPATLSVFRDCNPDAIATRCVSSSYEDREHEIEFNLTVEPQSIYYLVLDTYASSLREVMIQERAQLSDVIFELQLGR